MKIAIHVLTPLAAAACVTALALPGAAQAATRPAATVTLAKDRVTAGSTPSLTYLTSGAPAGSVTYLEVEQTGTGQWAEAERLGRSGTVTLPPVTTGMFSFRLLVTAAGHPVVTSPAVNLTVVPAQPMDMFSWLGQALAQGMGQALGEGAAAAVFALIGLLAA
jgi:hypothetical protein